MATNATLRKVKLTIAPEKNIGDEQSGSRNFIFDVIFRRQFVANSGDEAGEPSTPGDSTSPQPPLLIHDAQRYTVDGKFQKVVLLENVDIDEPVQVNFLHADGRPVVRKKVVLREEKPPAGNTDGTIPQDILERTLKVEEDEVELIKTVPPQPQVVPGDIKRRARLVSLNPSIQPINFSLAQLLVVPIRFTDLPPGRPTSANERAPWDLDAAPKQWAGSGFDELWKAQSKLSTASKTLESDVPGAILALNWELMRVAVDGRFTATFKPGPWNAWAWMLFGGGIQSPFLGIVIEALDQSIDKTRSIFLPRPKTPEQQNGTGSLVTSSQIPASSSHQPVIQGRNRVPLNVSAAELAANPDIYTEDPGAFCRPFSNPQRILSERSFFSILRIEAPVISAEATAKLEEPAQLDFDPPEEMLEAIRESATSSASTTSSSHPPRVSMRAAAVAPVFVAPPAILNGRGIFTNFSKGLATYIDHPPEDLQAHWSKLTHERIEMSAAQPLQWNGESIRYQATTVARGHVLEFRVRTRSNGYSLGGVAKTLTLAPRQTRRIQKISWARRESASRVEAQDFQETVADSVNHESSYENAVAANLSEWAQGSSDSSVKAAAFAAGGILGQLPVAVGGGAAASFATSSSEQSGGRNATAKEESQWRDAIQRHGESVRKFESTVVQEVTQDEDVTGTVEVIRNINYAHSLTVIYHNILRHQRVDTEFAGVRECLFVPFTMKPFTMARIYRWRETIRQVLKDRRFNHAMAYLRDVLSGFQGSTIPAGRRADHTIRSMYGSVYIELGIAQPSDNEHGAFNQSAWTALTPFLGLPAKATWQSLAAVVEAGRESEFQRRYAPGIAAKWCNTLELLGIDNQNLEADFTLATPYAFGRQVRVDFQVDTSSMNLTRAKLTTLVIQASSDLLPGSIANVRSIKYTYQTDHLTRSISLSQGANDLVDSTSGAVDRNGAALQSPLTLFETQNLRIELVHDTVELLQHLNEHVEYYHRMIWWYMDRDRLFMLLDGFYVPKFQPPTSIASIVDKNPIGVAGNSLIFRVSAGCFLGTPELQTAEQLDNWYRTSGPPTDPMHISLPTDGLYAQTLMDECEALEEHYGSLDWALNNPDPELGTIDPNLLTSRRGDPNTGTTPTKLPDTLINLQNANPAPPAQGFGGIFGAVGNANAFRDMAGLAGTQTLAAQGLDTASGLATNALNQAAALKMAEMASKAAATGDADRKLASLERSVNKGLIKDPESISQIAKDIHAESNGVPPIQPRNSDDITPKECREVTKVLEEEEKKGNISPEEKRDGVKKRTRRLPGGRSPGPTERMYGLTVRLLGFDDKPLAGQWWCFLGQTRVDNKENRLVELASGESRLAEAGIVRFPFPRTLGRSGSLYELRVKGFIYDGFDTPAKPDWIEKSLLLQIDDKLLDSNGSVIATARALFESVEVNESTGSELSTVINDGWKLGGEIGLGIKVEAGEALLGFLKKWAKGLAQVEGKLDGKVSGEKSHSETEKRMDTVQNSQKWTIKYYTGSFKDKVEVN
ncbi:uncharacterized protein HMPREF1541_08161 [Cyphellophora europaea CBS 101466]|uniref:Uncharacterized protein n=1 Tax=Cyphellophora europaea (strain CBS 101466) TaxID=1220924 RepID=W2RKZ5_CYPE1|nr:uncharacterized protein HMPREF1541_08161 [Cyphellophora europaea CBS 101466]ETN37171.1 hypothetical protein HMPREF1541_08161 [Cyphellophora europaea CBS 101466]